MNFTKRFFSFEGLLVTVILSIHLYAAFSDAYNFPSVWFIRDDAYYYFKVAQNISIGLGSTFDGINLTNGYHPLWMLICIPVFAFARFDLILPLRILLIIIAGFNAATSILIYRMLKTNLSHAVAITAASLWAFNLYIHLNIYMLGLETPLAVFTIILLIYKLTQLKQGDTTKRQIITLAIIATLVMFSRLDLIFFVVICGIWIIFRNSPIRFLLPMDILFIFISIVTAVALRTGIGNYNTIYARSTTEVTMMVMAIKIIALYFFGAYQHPRTKSIWTIIRQTAYALTASLLASSGAYLLLASLGIGQNFPRSAFAIDWGVSFILILALRLAYYWFGSQNIKVDGYAITPLHELQDNWKKWISEGATYYGIIGGALTLYMIYNKITFGTFSPVSGQIKRWWGSLTNTVYGAPALNWVELLGISPKWTYNTWQFASNFFIWMAQRITPLYPGSVNTDERYYISIFAFIIFALIVLFANKKQTSSIASKIPLIPLAAGCGIQILSYTATAYGETKEWYWASQAVFTILAGSVLLHFILLPLQKLKLPNRTLELASIILSLTMAYNFSANIISTMPHNYFPADRVYLDVLPYLEENTPPGSIIGMTGGGNAGYFIRNRTIVNMDGLINSNEYFHALQNGTAAKFLSDQGITIVFANTHLLDLPPYFGQFDSYLQSYSVFGGKRLLYLLKEPK